MPHPHPHPQHLDDLLVVQHSWACVFGAAEAEASLRASFWGCLVNTTR